jgi:hypothetical protein
VPMKRMFRKITAFILSFILLSSSLVMPKANAASTSDGDALIGKYINLGSYNGAKVLYRIIGLKTLTGTAQRSCCCGPTAPLRLSLLTLVAMTLAVVEAERHRSVIRKARTIGPRAI